MKSKKLYKITNIAYISSTQNLTQACYIKGVTKIFHYYYKITSIEHTESIIYYIVQYLI